MADVWACSNCRSLNQGKDRCYKCRSPRALGGVAPAELPTIGPSAPVVAKIPYRSSAFRALIASVALMSLATAIVVWAILAATRSASAGTSGDMFILVGVLLVLTLVTFAAWLSRVVENVPALTGAFPKATPRLTFIQALVPVANLGWIPSILREVLRHLDPRGNGDALVAAAVLPPAVAAVGWLGLRYLFAGTRIGGGLATKQVVEIIGVLGQMTVGLFAIAAVMLVVIVSRIERRAAALARNAR